MDPKFDASKVNPHEFDIIKNGKFNSWIIHNDNLVAKETDKPVFEHHGSGVLKKFANSLKVDDLALKDKINLTLI